MNYLNKQLLECKNEFNNKVSEFDALVKRTQKFLTQLESNNDDIKSDLMKHFIIRIYGFYQISIKIITRYCILKSFTLRETRFTPLKNELDDTNNDSTTHHYKFDKFINSIKFTKIYRQIAKIIGWNFKKNNWDAACWYMQCKNWEKERNILAHGGNQKTYPHDDLNNAIQFKELCIKKIFKIIQKNNF